MTAKELAAFLATRTPEELREALAFWGDGAGASASRTGLAAALAARMADPAVVAERLRDLGRKLSDLLDHFLDDPAFSRTEAELRRAPCLERLGSLEREAAVHALERRGFVFATGARAWRSGGETAFAVPPPLGERILEIRRRTVGTAYDALTLRGFLDRSRSPRAKNAPGGAAVAATLRVRRTWRVLADGDGIRERIARLGEPLPRLVREAAVRTGGILPKSLFEKIDLGFDRFDEERWRRELERASLGTVAHLDLARYGIRLSEPTLLLFVETTLAVLRGISRDGPPAVARESVCGVDLASNLSRLLASVVEGRVRFTADGAIFKTTERRLVDELLPVRTKEVEPGEVLELLQRFALGRRLLDRTGERAFALSAAGRAFGALPLDEKMERLLDFAVEERGLPGEWIHQARLRRFFLRLLRRLEPARWVDAMSLPFVVRNAYLTRLDSLQVEEFFSSRAPHAVPAALEDPQRLAWNLLTWVRRRLHPLGLVDLGYDRPGRLLAMRLSGFGARLLSPRRGPEGTGGGSLVVNPDFEAVLFPGEADSHELVHALDRFADRTKADRVFHYRVSERSVRRALAEGMSAAAIVDTLKGASRVPVPQNVLYSIRAWASRARVLRVDSVALVRCDDAEVLDRFLADPRVRERLVERSSPTTALLRDAPRARAIRSLAAELGVRLRPA